MMSKTKRLCTRLFLSCTAILVLTACQATPSAVPSPGSVQDQASFVRAVRARGFTVDELGRIDQPFLQAEGMQLRVSGGNLRGPTGLQAFDYDDNALGTDGLKAASDDASEIGPDGNPRTMQIEWIAPPHFFHRDRIIVIYLGDDPRMLTLLQELLGPQFAGK